MKIKSKQNGDRRGARPKPEDKKGPFWGRNGLIFVYKKYELFKC
jgi:hypothetical protein